MTRAHPHLAGQESVALPPDALGKYDAVVILTDHSSVDYEMLGAHANLIIDTRNAMNGLALKGRLVKA